MEQLFDLELLMTILTILAIIIGPIVALWIQRYIEKRREQRNRKLVLFKEMMATRASRTSRRHVDALNTIRVEFSEGGGAGNKRVLKTWKLYLDHLGNTSDTWSPDQTQRWEDQGLKLLIDLLFEMSRSLQYNFDKVALENEIYAPRGHRQDDEDELALRKQVLDITAGRSPIWITLDEPPPPPS